MPVFYSEQSHSLPVKSKLFILNDLARFFYHQLSIFQYLKIGLLAYFLFETKVS